MKDVALASLISDYVGLVTKEMLVKAQERAYAENVGKPWVREYGERADQFTYSPRAKNAAEIRRLAGAT